jgi:phage terminase small subunit
MKEEGRILFEEMTRLEKDVSLNVLSGMSYAPAYFAAGGVAKNEKVARVIVTKIMKAPRVQAFVKYADEQAVDDAIMTKSEALRRLTVLANGNVTDLVDFKTVEFETADGPARQSVWVLKDQASLSKDNLAIISELSASKDGFKFKTHAPTQAIAQLSKMLGWEAPVKVAQTNIDGDDQPSLMEMARTVAFALESAMANQDTTNSSEEGE